MVFPILLLLWSIKNILLTRFVCRFPSTLSKTCTPQTSNNPGGVVGQTNLPRTKTLYPFPPRRRAGLIHGLGINHNLALETSESLWNPPPPIPIIQGPVFLMHQPMHVNHNAPHLENIPISSMAFRWFHWNFNTSTHLHWYEQQRHHK